MTTKVLTAHIPLPLAEKIDQFATRLERSRTWIIKQALSAWIDHEEERQRLTIEAMDAVQEWTESLSTETPLPLPQ
jgi:predicted transcriptional regulator